jgi:hypothetical protein
VNSQHVLDISQTKAVPQFGKIGLFVDIGTQAFFSQLKTGAL